MSIGRRRLHAAGRAQRIVGYLLIGLWIARRPRPRRLSGALAGTRNSSPNMRLHYLSGLGVTLALVVISIVDRRHPVGADRLCAHVAQSRCCRLSPMPMSISSAARRCSRRPSWSTTGWARSGRSSRPIGLWAFFREAWYCAIFAFSLNTAAYQAEILRGAIESVPKGQWEGAASLGLHKLQTLVEGDPAAGADRGAAPLRQRDHPDDQGLGDRRHHHGLRPDGRRRGLPIPRSFDFQTYIWAALIYFALVETLRHRHRMDRAPVDAAPHPLDFPHIALDRIQAARQTRLERGTA